MTINAAVNAGAGEVRIVTAGDRSAGAFAPDSAPAGIVQRLLESHFAGDMGFDATTAASKRAWLTDALRTRIARYFAKSRPSDDVPPIDGDPFTDS